MRKKTKVKTVKKVKKFAASTGGDGLPVESSREERLRDQVATLGVMAKATIARLDRQDQQTWEIIRKFENEPMVPGSAIWHVYR